MKCYGQINPSEARPNPPNLPTWFLANELVPIQYNGDLLDGKNYPKSVNSLIICELTKIDKFYNIEIQNISSGS